MGAVGGPFGACLCAALRPPPPPPVLPPTSATPASLGLSSPHPRPSPSPFSLPASAPAPDTPSAAVAAATRLAASRRSAASRCVAEALRLRVQSIDVRFAADRLDLASSAAPQPAPAANGGGGSKAQQQRLRLPRGRILAVCPFEVHHGSALYGESSVGGSGQEAGGRRLQHVHVQPPARRDRPGAVRSTHFAVGDDIVQLRLLPHALDDHTRHMPRGRGRRPQAWTRGRSTPRGPSSR